MITTLNEDNECLAVEWVENGDTKGTEIVLESVFSFNFEILSVEELEPSPEIFFCSTSLAKANKME
jgi:kinesin family protein 2/24